MHIYGRRATLSTNFEQKCRRIPAEKHLRLIKNNNRRKKQQQQQPKNEMKREKRERK